VKEKDLLKVSLVFSLIGILIIFFLTNTLEVKKYDIGSLSKDNLDDSVKVKGFVSSFIETPGLYIITLKDDTGKIPVIIFKDEELPLREGLELEIIGDIVEYQDKIEIILKEIVN